MYKPQFLILQVNEGLKIKEHFAFISFNGNTGSPFTQTLVIHVVSSVNPPIVVLTLLYVPLLHVYICNIQLLTPF